MELGVVRGMEIKFERVNWHDTDCLDEGVRTRRRYKGILVLLVGTA